MEDTFTFVAPVTARREIDPFALRLAIGMTVLTLLVGSFAVFLIAHERAADAQRADLEAQAVDRPTDASASDGSDVMAGGIADAEARSSLERTLALAQAIFRQDGSFAAADPISLQMLQPSLVFVDGPSTAPRIVSVASGGDGWAAAAMGTTGTCSWVRAVPGHGVDHGTGGVCTATAALAAGPAAP
jgi:hypothetical protein